MPILNSRRAKPSLSITWCNQNRSHCLLFKASGVFKEISPPRTFGLNQNSDVPDRLAVAVQGFLLDHWGDRFTAAKNRTQMMLLRSERGEREDRIQRVSDLLIVLLSKPFFLKSVTQTLEY
ncbi:hypothetical protein [Rubripirellula tenax]|uniref:hypothetical protein n=1 Tax=Rubripirellula tenax TaxID=2528015 RepID=UPI0011B78F66|nr:hypothetical protein [Rubripirellula tenax]